MDLHSLKNVMFRMKEINDKFESYYSKLNKINRSFFMKKSIIDKGINVENSENKFKNLLFKENKDLSEKNKINNPPISPSISEIIKQASYKYGIPENLIYSMIKAESSFNPKAVSTAGAKGLMQLMPKTAEYLGVKDVYDPQQNIMGGVKYMKELLDHFNGNLKLSLASYNAGIGRVTKKNGIPNIQETHSYIKNVLNSYNSVKF